MGREDKWAVEFNVKSEANHFGEMLLKTAQTLGPSYIGQSQGQNDS